MSYGTFPVKAAGIPARVRVTHFLHVPPSKLSAWHCDSPDDYYGYTELEFEVLDQRGRPAAWLEKKLTDRDRERIQAEVVQQMKEQ